MAVKYLPTSDYQRKRFFQIYESTLSIHKALKESGITYAQFKALMERSVRFRAKVEEVEARMTEAVELALFKAAVEKGNVSAAIFWLCNRKPERWKSITRQETKVESPTVVKLIDVDISKYPKQQGKTIIAEAMTRKEVKEEALKELKAIKGEDGGKKE